MSELFQLVGKIVIDSKDAEDTMDRMIQKANDLTTALGGTSNSAAGASESIKEVGESAGTATGGVQGATDTMEKASSTSVFLGNMWTNIATKGIGFAKKFVDEANAYNMEIQKNIGSMTAYFGGDKQKAEAFVDELKGLDKETPYDLGGLLKAATNLAQFGVPTDELLETLTMLGNIAAGDENKLYGLARVYGQTVSTGKLTGQDVLQYASNGFAITEALKKMYGYSGEELAEMQKNGQITPDMVKQVLIAETSPGGRYYGMLEAIMATPYGAQERFKSDYAMAQGEIVEPLTEKLGDLYPVLSDVVNFLAENDEETRLGMNLVGTAGAYTLLSKFLPGLKGVSLKSFIKSHPILATIFGVGEFLNYADEKAADAEERLNFYSFPEKVNGTGDGEYSGLLGELLETPQDIAHTLSMDKETRQETTKNMLDFLRYGTLGGSQRFKTTSGDIAGGRGGNYAMQEAAANSTVGYGVGLWGELLGTQENTPKEKWYKPLDGWFFDTFGDILPTIDPVASEVYGPPTPNWWTPTSSAPQVMELGALSAQMGQMISLLQQIATNGKQPIYLNTGALVGGMLPAINSGLGAMVRVSEVIE